MFDTDRVISNNITELLDRSQKRQSDLADHLGVSRPVMRKIMGGGRAFTAKELNSVAEFFNVPKETLTAVPEGMKETNAIRAFMGKDVSSGARRALEIADELADMILFYAGVRENAEAMMAPWNP